MGDKVKNTRMRLFVVCMGLLAFATVAFAHHGTANYDTTKTVSVTGTINGFQFVNPHVIITWDAKDSAGKVQKWQGELTSPNRLTRYGWNKDTLKVGDAVTISGFPTKSGSNEIWIQKIVRSNGEELPLKPGN
jgi:Family of unknown function (DUF6152)